ncbi:MAG TPA: translation initiation factor IF-6 [Nitrososphaerales archaeon]|nr:translation initiation factor IF-6 [Nitrososphaerales archaeon]HUK75891.1 translation initiation factor IF-6 [Nitrososphaerales archaeon]
MGLHLVDIYRSPNIGIFLKANDRTVLVPKGIAATKAEKLATDLGVEVCYSSVGGTRLLGPLVAMNNKGALASRMIEDYEIREISSKTGLRVERLQSRYTAVGNLVAANDHGAVVSPILEHHAVEQVRAVLGTDTFTTTVGEFAQVGAMVLATNGGAAVSPNATEEEAAGIARILKVEVSASSVNGGIPFTASGAVANSRNAVAGYLTTGPELVFLTRALNV